MQPKIKAKHLKVAELTDQQAKAKALDIYCTMGVVNMSEISRRVHRSKELIESWREAGNWLDIRAAVWKDNYEQLCREIERPEVATVELIKTAKRLRDAVNVILERKLSPGEAKVLMESLEKLQAIFEKAYGKLKF